MAGSSWDLKRSVIAKPVANLQADLDNFGRIYFQIERISFPANSALDWESRSFGFRRFGSGFCTAGKIPNGE
jgi:hypothetical protein